MSFDQNVKAFGQWSQSLAYATYSVSSFSASFASGGPVIQSFIGSLQNLTSGILAYSTKAFDKGRENEISRVAGGGAISNSFDKKLNFDQGTKLYDDMLKQAAKSAAALPGATSEYVTAFRLLSDDMAAALNSSSAGADELANLFKTKVPKAVENLVLQSKLYGQDIPISSVTKTYSTLLSTGKVNPNEIFVKRNPVLKTAMQKWEKDNGKKLPSLGLTERFEALNKIFKDSISPEQMQALLNSFDSKLESLKSYTFDPLSGLFGFEREFKNASGETTTMFQTLANALGPVVERLGTLAQNLLTFADPLQALANLFDATLAIELGKFAERIGVLNHYLQITEGDFSTKLHTALIKSFNFDYKTFDFAGAITSFFDKLAKSIETFGDNIKPSDKFNAAISALLSGLVKVLGALMGRVFRQIAEHPVETFKFVAVTNPGLLLQGFTMLAVSLSVLLPVISLLFKGLMGLGSLLLKIPAIGSALGALWNIVVAVAGAFAGIIGVAVVIVAFVAGIVLFKDQLLSAGKHFTDLSTTMSGPFKDATQILGWSLTKLGEAGAALSNAWNKFTSGDWRGAVIDLFKGLVKTIQSLFGGVGAGASAALGLVQIAWEGLYPLLEKLGKFIINGIFNLLTGSTKDEVSRRAAAVNSLPEINQTGAPLDPLTNVFKNQVNTLGKFYFPDNKPVFQYATGNGFGNLLSAISTERASMPSGSSIAIANSSEAIIPRNQAQQMLSQMSTPSKNIGNVTIYITESNASASDIGLEVRNQLVALLS